jgi:hypothetical protein
MRPPFQSANHDNLAQIIGLFVGAPALARRRTPSASSPQIAGVGAGQQRCRRRTRLLPRPPRRTVRHHHRQQRPVDRHRRRRRLRLPGPGQEGLRCSNASGKMTTIS